MIAAEKNDKPREENEAISYIDAAVSDHIIRSAEFSYKSESDRGDSVSSLASKMLTAISVISIALISLLPQLIQSLPDFVCVIAVAYVIVFFPLLASLVLCLLSQYRYIYRTLAGPQSVCDQIRRSHENESPFESKIEIAAHYCESIESSYSSLRKKNSLICKLLNSAVVTLVVAIGLAILAFFFILLLIGVGRV